MQEYLFQKGIGRMIPEKLYTFVDGISGKKYFLLIKNY